MYLINIVLCPIKVNSYTIELTVHPSCYYVLDLLYVTHLEWKFLQFQKFVSLIFFCYC